MRTEPEAPGDFSSEVFAEAQPTMSTLVLPERDVTDIPLDQARPLS